MLNMICKIATLNIRTTLQLTQKAESNASRVQTRGAELFEHDVYSPEVEDQGQNDFWTHSCQRNKLLMA